ncbi:hypothetical protein ACPCSC_30245 [Streptomyces lavendulocolor]|uniref:hypothetical protein n=1 Tax=Streptomyces lavendulocolor TaxID=67316 RepID=UPI003C309B3B
MSTTTAPAVPALATVIITALTNAGVGAFWDTELILIAHPAGLTQEQALTGEHVVIDWMATPGATTLEGAKLEATAWEPDSLPDYAQIATLHATPPGCPRGEEVAQCVTAVAEWFAGPRQTAGGMLLAALAEYGLVEGKEVFVSYGTHSDRYSVPLPLADGTQAQLIIADRDGSLRHLPNAHTGWSVILHDGLWGEPIGDPVYITGDGELVDCAEDSANAAAFMADFVTAPVSRHCDCYAQDGHWRRHDRECNRYRRP